MRIKDGFILREVAGKVIVVSVGERAMEFSGMITLNSTAAYLWRKAESDFTKESLVKALTDEYDVSDEDAAKAVDNFVEVLTKENLIEGADS